MISRRLLATLLTPGLRRFSDRHVGQTCYIFGDGASLKWFDLGAFADHPSICCGMMPFHRDFHRLDVAFVTFVAPWMFLPKALQPRMYRPLNGIAREYRELLRRLRDTQFFISLSNRPAVSGPNIHYVYRGLPRDKNETDRALNGIDLYGGAFHASLSLAYYAGFSRFYLVGFDGWTIQPARSLHWYEHGESDFFEAQNFATEFLGALQREVDIYTVSLDGTSKNVKNVRYAELTGRAPVYRENHELLSDHHMGVLATYPGYRIYP